MKTQKSQNIDQLFVTAEKLAKDFSIFPKKDNLSIDHHINGLVSDVNITKRLDELQKLDVDEYIDQVVTPTEAQSRLSARGIIQHLGYRIINEKSNGAFYSVEAEVDFGDGFRRIGFICQERTSNNGAWMPEHHLAACEAINKFAAMSIPVVGLVDTPGADAGEEANLNNQAHSISRLLAEFSNADVPTVGIIIGVGYSGGAIPLLTTNLILSVRDGIYNTIQPKGLASIARKYNLSWQECAKYVGVSPYELTRQGCIDGIVDYIPGEQADKLINFHQAIVSSIKSIEEGAQKFVRDNPYILDHYHNAIQRYLNPTEERLALEGNDGLSIVATPTEHLNVFGVSYKYLRYLSLRKRIHSTKSDYYGRLSKVEVPQGELQKRLDQEKNRAFNSWLQNPDKIIYDDTLRGAWKDYISKKSDLKEGRNPISKFIFGEPKRNFKDARSELFFQTGLFLYNRWKGNAKSNFLALMTHIQDYQNNLFLLRNEEFTDVKGFIDLLTGDDNPFAKHLNQEISKRGSVLLEDLKQQNEEQACKNLALALNEIMSSGEGLYCTDLVSLSELSEETQEIVSDENATTSIIANRKLLQEVFNKYIKTRKVNTELPDTNELTILDIVLHEEFRHGFFVECQNILIFDAVYGHIVNNLFQIAHEAKDTKALSKDTVKDLLQSALDHAAETANSFGLNHIGSEERANMLNDQFSDWIRHFVGHNDRGTFLKTVEEWNSIINPQMSDSLFVIITFFFEKILLEYYQSEQDGKEYKGLINPVRIGRRKDFWNRLNMAYHDLLISNLLTKIKRKKLNSSKAIIDKFLTGFEETKSSLLTSDPVKFPGFRISVEEALDKGTLPCGVVTGFASFKSDKQNRRVGVLISNVDFQAGAFDMASAEKFCDLLVQCATENLPIVCFVSSGGMQTKEGAGALFSMAIVNDRITRFVRDNDLPILIFGYGDCTGGAQASFVTHPLVQTYYLSGTNMPFAGQVVVPAYLPTTATLSNYLSAREGAMQGLVKNPFVDDLDQQLRAVDPEIPVPVDTVEDVFERVIEGSYNSSVPVPSQQVEEQDKIELMKPVKRTLIHARGCTAVKLIRKAQDNGIEVVLIQSDPDMQSVPAEMLTEKDRLICIGGNTSDESYLNPHSVLRVADYAEVDSLHPGIGFLSESAQFAGLCHNHQINFIGPSVYSMEMMGNKSNAINTALSLEVPVVPGSHGILTSSDKAASVAEEIGYPVLLKAVHGGGGKGIQVIEDPSEVHELFHRISTEAKSAFGNGDIYMEKYVTSLRHIEIQLLRDKFGNTKVLGLRDCSVQRNNQKVIEESGSTMLPEELKVKAYDYAAALADKVEYLGAGTVEFIYNLDVNELYFMEMNTRLQVEHPVTESTSGIDIVSAQFDIASGKSIEHLDAKDEGFAIEVRVTAEKLEITADGEIDILPFPGNIEKCILPEKDYIEIISMAETGKSVSPFYDSLIAQIICTGTDREDCAEKLIAYLSECTIHGICTNIPLLIHILKDDTFRKGIYDTTYLPKLLARIDKEGIIAETEKYAGIDNNAVDTDIIKIEDSNELKVLSPSTGIFYISSSPTEPDFVKEGDEITLDQTICLMEAMKIFTPLKLDSFNKANQKLYAKGKYRVERINNENGTQVAAGDLLFVIRPI